MFVLGILVFKFVVDINMVDVRDFFDLIIVFFFYVGIIFVFFIVLFILFGLFFLMVVGYFVYGCCCKCKIGYKRVSIFGIVKINSYKIF